MPRKKRTSARIEECLGRSAAPEFDDGISLQKNILRVLGLYNQCHRNRIDLEDFKTYIKLENLLLKAANGSDFHIEYNDVMALYDSDFYGIRFHVQLITLSEYCKEPVDTASVRTVTEVLRNIEVRNHLCEVYKLAKFIMVMPATNSTSDRTFSLLKPIKIYLQSTMTQGRLNHWIILSAYRNRIDEMDLTKAALISVKKK